MSSQKVWFGLAVLNGICALMAYCAKQPPMAWHHTEMTCIFAILANLDNYAWMLFEHITKLTTAYNDLNESMTQALEQKNDQLRSAKLS